MESSFANIYSEEWEPFDGAAWTAGMTEQGSETENSHGNASGGYNNNNNNHNYSSSAMMQRGLRRRRHPPGQNMHRSHHFYVGSESLVERERASNRVRADTSTRNRQSARSARQPRSLLLLLETNESRRRYSFDRINGGSSSGSRSVSFNTSTVGNSERINQRTTVPRQSSQPNLQLLYNWQTTRSHGQNSANTEISRGQDNSTGSMPDSRPLRIQKSMIFFELTESYFYSDSAQYLGETDLSTAVCSVCLCGYECWQTAAQAKGNSCAHLFHKDCITSWLASHDDCPLCRKVIVGW